MKSWEIIKCIRETDIEHSTRLLEDIFMYGYIKGIQKGYENAMILYSGTIITSDIEAGRKIFTKKYQ